MTWVFKPPILLDLLLLPHIHIHACFCNMVCLSRSLSVYVQNMKRQIMKDAWTHVEIGTEMERLS